MSPPPEKNPGYAHACTSNEMLNSGEMEWCTLHLQMSTMPGLPTRPCFFDIDLDTTTGQVLGLMWSTPWMDSSILSLVQSLFQSLFQLCLIHAPHILPFLHPPLILIIFSTDLFWSLSCLPSSHIPHPISYSSQTLHTIYYSRFRTIFHTFRLFCSRTFR